MVADFDALSWDERGQWLDRFVEETGYIKWVEDIQGDITDLFIGDEAFEDLGGNIANMDAPVLQAINDGARIWREGGDSHRS